MLGQGSGGCRAREEVRILLVGDRYTHCLDPGKCRELLIEMENKIGYFSLYHFLMNLL